MQESAILFSSCYTANASVIPTMIKMMPPGTTIFSDAKNHASLIEGIRHSGAPKVIITCPYLHDVARVTPTLIL